MSNCFSFLYKMIILNTIFAGKVHTRLGFFSTNINTHDFEYLPCGGRAYTIGLVCTDHIVNAIFGMSDTF